MPSYIRLHALCSFPSVYKPNQINNAYHNFLSQHRKTPDEQLILQKLNQMSPSEQSRFEAFKQSTFSNTAVSNYIAACLIHSNKRSSRSRLNHIRLIGGGEPAVLSSGENDSSDTCNKNDDKNNNHIEQHLQHQDQIIPPSERAAIEANSVLSSIHHHHHPEIKLSNLVAPGTSSKITAVVTTLAKINAQRLVQSARIIATRDFKYDPTKPLLPKHLLEAHRRQMRNQNGNNGFFMKSSSSSPSFTEGGMGGSSSSSSNRPSFLSDYCSIGNVSGKSMSSSWSSRRDRSVNEIQTTSTEQSQIRYMAAIHAQEAYDDLFPTQEEEEEEEKNFEDEGDKHKEEEMDIDSNVEELKSSQETNPKDC